MNVIRRTVAVFAILSLPAAGIAQVQNFDSLNGYATGPENRLLVIRDRALEDLSDNNETRVSLHLRYLDREIDPAAERFQRESDGYGLRARFLGGMGSWSLGFDIDYEELETDYFELNPPGLVTRGGVIETKGYQLAVNFLGHHEGWRFGLQGGYGHADHEATRRSDAGISTAKFNSQEYFLVGRVEHLFGIGENATITPFVAGATTYVKTDGFRERGVSPDRRMVEDFSIRENLGILGIRLARQWNHVEPSFSVAWIRRLSGDSFDIVSKEETGVNRWTGSVESPYTNLLALGLSVDIALQAGWRLRPELRFLQGGDDTQWTLGIGAGYSF